MYVLCKISCNSNRNLAMNVIGDLTTVLKMTAEELKLFLTENGFPSTEMELLRGE